MREETSGDNRMVLTGHKISLRPFTESDISAKYVSWLNDPIVVRFSNQRFRQHTWQTCIAYLNSFKGTDNMFMAILLGEKVVGTITAYVATAHRRADMGILVGNPQTWGKGVGLDAWRTLMNHLLADHSIRKVTGGTLRCNTGMVRIMQKSGMVQDGVRVAHELVEGVPQDMLHFATFNS
jgi:RimJ/RimL family protein N-acetyltransferase